MILECVDIAQQAPVGSNAQHWHFVVVTDAVKREAIAKLYRQVFAGYREAPIYASALPTKDAAHARTQNLVADSASYLSEHLAECPVLVIPCIERRVAGVEIGAATSLACILPASWPFMLAARARGSVHAGRRFTLLLSSRSPRSSESRSAMCRRRCSPRLPTRLVPTSNRRRVPTRGRSRTSTPGSRAGPTRVDFHSSPKPIH